MVVAFWLTLVAGTGYSAEKASYIDVTSAKAKELIEKTPGIVIIDVSPAYAKGHLPGAVNYYLGDGSLEKAIPTLDKNKTYLVYCHVDKAAIQGARKLVDAGFKKVYRLTGNYKAWVDAGYPVEKQTLTARYAILEGDPPGPPFLTDAVVRVRPDMFLTWSSPYRDRLRKTVRAALLVFLNVDRTRKMLQDALLIFPAYALKAAPARDQDIVSPRT